MKQKVVIKVSMSDQHSRKKALKTVVGCLGVESTALQGQDRDQIEVIGDGIDAVKITTLLRKNVGYSEIVSVSTVEDKKKEEKKDDSKAAEFTIPPPVVWTANINPYTYNGTPYQTFYEVRDSNSDPCSIM